MSELEQWCEIDGHIWQRTGFFYGMVLGPKTETWTDTCVKCLTSESKTFLPYPEHRKYWFPIIGYF